MIRRVSAAAVVAAVCGAVVLTAPAHSAGTPAARGAAVLAPPQLCTPEEEDKGATDNAVAKQCHVLRARSAADRAHAYSQIITGNPDALLEDVQAAQAADEAATAAEADAVAAPDAAQAASAAWAVATAGAKLTADRSGYYPLDIRNTAEAAKDAASDAEDEQTNGPGQDAALNKKADQAEAAAQAALAG
ncbi:hypothetical protein [Streptomyces sp. NRRL B-1347]|uniref:hypothetical protein n=1 Tax=Streptomyces sp. NRRL B-1347 TaxID=1476877 RepID=UPI00068939F2|nr:hypothetical protein [Streptomyces sp. NRRL B-1347]